MSLLSAVPQQYCCTVQRAVQVQYSTVVQLDSSTVQYYSTDSSTVLYSSSTDSTRVLYDTAHTILYSTAVDTKGMLMQHIG